MTILKREDILNAEDGCVETVLVPEWDGEVRVKTMSGVERDAFEASLFEEKGGDIKRNISNLRAKLLVRCIVGEKGERLFTDKDIDVLGKKSSVALDRIYGIAQRLNGIGVKEVDELTKNSGGEEKDISISPSPENSDAQ